jgi:hypothetical protein
MSSLTPPPFQMMSQSYMHHATSAIPPPPPAYTEARHDDLAAQLEQMKAMMEQMRLDKERLEMDAKRKVEEEAAAKLREKQEMEAAAARQKEKKELDEVFKLFTDSTVSFQNGKWSEEVWKNAGQKEIQFLRKLEQAGETILLVHIQESKYGSWDGKTHHLWSIGPILTNKGLYTLVYSPTCPDFYGTCLYTFSEPLTLPHAKILSSIITVPKHSSISLAVSSVWQRVAYGLRDGASYARIFVQSIKNFETIIRLIPGSYKNGAWKQMDGFFGVYLNEETMEVSEVPPPSL